ncbi:uncharacterized protein LOC113105467 isoform X2 [Carassius auratus]|uniref:Uncharacterized protein LOC113105467 isoform X2 n=1 Tax=Carassius auratus TaxID=7957 RepID=A0A6P6PL53_CARAU|nr:uncharacterized protein LOC113105467 isoform X2 [Carassius auratus]XP_026122331.1 uncharacterized protein LOC113105467 isoform X2 [Carassius auratus]
MEVIRRTHSDSNGLFSDHDCQDTGACGRTTGVCLCEHQLPQDDSSVKCVQCGNRAMITRYSEGYGTEEECVQPHLQGDSDADADIEDTDSRLQIVGSLQRISSRKRKRQRITRQDTTESEDDGGRSHRTHRWSLRLSPHRTHNRTILEESVSQVRPLVICRCAARETVPDHKPHGGRWLLTLFPVPLSLSVSCYLLIVPLSVSIIIVLVSVLLPLTDT